MLRTNQMQLDASDSSDGALDESPLAGLRSMMELDVDDIGSFAQKGTNMYTLDDFLGTIQPMIQPDNLRVSVPIKSTAD